MSEKCCLKFNLGWKNGFDSLSLRSIHLNKKWHNNNFCFWKSGNRTSSCANGTFIEELNSEMELKFGVKSLCLKCHPACKRCTGYGLNLVWIQLIMLSLVNFLWQKAQFTHGHLCIRFPNYGTFLRVYVDSPTKETFALKKCIKMHTMHVCTCCFIF